MIIFGCHISYLMGKKDEIRLKSGWPKGDVVCQNENCDILISEDERFIDHDYCYECVCEDCFMPLTEADKKRGDGVTCGTCDNELTAKLNELDAKGLCWYCEKEPKAEGFEEDGCPSNKCKKCQKDESWFW